MPFVNSNLIFLWHCGGCLIKQARRYARRQAPAINKTKPKVIIKKELEQAMSKLS